MPPCGPIRIRNLEDLLRQLEQNPPVVTTSAAGVTAVGHPSHHSSGAISGISPAGSEDIRLSEPEADRHLYSSSGRGTGTPHTPGSSHYRTPTSQLGVPPPPRPPDQHLVDQGLQYLLGHRHLGIPPPPPPAQAARFMRDFDNVEFSP